MNKKPTCASLKGKRARMVHKPGCPDPSKARYNCDCGANCSCPSCGWGAGAWPCKCRPIVFDPLQVTFA